MKQSIAIGLIAAVIFTALSLLFGTLVWWQVVAFALFAMLAEFAVGSRHRRK